MIEQILETENLERACEHLREKRVTCGVDGMRLSELADYLRNNMDALRRSVMDGTFQLGQSVTQQSISA